MSETDKLGTSLFAARLREIGLTKEDVRRSLGMRCPATEEAIGPIEIPYDPDRCRYVTKETMDAAISRAKETTPIMVSLALAGYPVSIIEQVVQLSRESVYRRLRHVGLSTGRSGNPGVRDRRAPVAPILKSAT